MKCCSYKKNMHAISWLISNSKDISCTINTSQKCYCPSFLINWHNTSLCIKLAMHESFLEYIIFKSFHLIHDFDNIFHKVQNMLFMQTQKLISLKWWPITFPPIHTHPRQFYALLMKKPQPTHVIVNTLVQLTTTSNIQITFTLTHSRSNANICRDPRYKKISSIHLHWIQTIGLKKTQRPTQLILKRM